MVEAESSSPSVEPRYEELAVRFGHRLTAEQLAQVRRRIERSVRLAEEMKVTSLTNADEPEIVFTPYRSES
jgi:hypothetical protein